MNQKLIEDRNIMLRKILNKEENIDILRDIIETYYKIEIKNIKIKEYEKGEGVIIVSVETYDESKMNIGIQFIGPKECMANILKYYIETKNDELQGEKTSTLNFIDGKLEEEDKRIHYVANIKVKSNEKTIVEKEAIFDIIQLENIEEDAKDVYNSEEAWNIYLKGTNNRLLELAKARNFYIKKLDKLVDKYIEEKIYQ